ncbi:MaoC/PaaZ C-terminal domain-containing protein [Nocardia sp. NPDC003482]
MEFDTPTPFVATTATVTAGQVRAYAAATLQADLGADGGVPPLFAVGALAGPALEELRARHLGRPGPTLVHAEQTVRLGAAPRIGETVGIRARIGALVDVGPAPALVLEVWIADTVGHATVLMPDLPRVHRAASRPPRPEIGAALGDFEIALPAELAARYADATGDRNPIHLDPAVARAAGLPGVVLHGMATYAIVWAAARRILTDAGVDGEFVGSRTRFALPVLPGAALAVTVHRTGDPALVAVTARQHGRRVLRDTYLTLDRPIG